MASSSDLDVASRRAVVDALDFLHTDLGVERSVAYAYLSAADLEVSQVLDRTVGVLGVIRTDHFRRVTAARASSILTNVEGAPSARAVAIGILVLTVGQLLVASFVTGLPQFAGKGFGARLVAYPLLMLLVPTLWALRRRLRGGTEPLPWAGFALVMAPFLIDVTGNTVNLYDTVAWWDDANHLVNWFLLCAGIGVLLLRAGISPPWALGALVTGIGALLAVGWELAEWYAFIRHGTELDTAYQDTLGDEALGTLGAALAGVAVVRLARHRRES